MRFISLLSYFLFFYSFSSLAMYGTGEEFVFHLYEPVKQYKHYLTKEEFLFYVEKIQAALKNNYDIVDLESGKKFAEFCMDCPEHNKNKLVEAFVSSYEQKIQDEERRKELRRARQRRYRERCRAKKASKNPGCNAQLQHKYEVYEYVLDTRGNEGGVLRMAAPKQALEHQENKRQREEEVILPPIGGILNGTLVRDPELRPSKKQKTAHEERR